VAVPILFGVMIPRTAKPRAAVTANRRRDGMGLANSTTTRRIEFLRSVTAEVRLRKSGVRDANTEGGRKSPSTITAGRSMANSVSQGLT